MLCLCQGCTCISFRCDIPERRSSVPQARGWSVLVSRDLLCSSPLVPGTSFPLVVGMHLLVGLIQNKYNLHFPDYSACARPVCPATSVSIGNVDGYYFYFRDGEAGGPSHCPATPQWVRNRSLNPLFLLNGF